MQLEHLLKQEAGRALDRAVAERAGYEFTTEWVEIGPFHSIGREVDDGEYPRYSTSVDDALSLVPDALTFSMSRTSLDWGATIYERGKHNYGSARTPALAIVRAWLLWKGGDNG